VKGYRSDSPVSNSYRYNSPTFSAEGPAWSRSFRFIAMPANAGLYLR
jgi:hypothetical protein